MRRQRIIEEPWSALHPPVDLALDPCSSAGKESACNARDLGWIPGTRRSSGKGNGNPLQYSCLQNLWAEEPGRLPSIRSQRVGHNWRTNTFTYCYLQRLANGINHLPEQESDSCAASHESLGCKADQQKPRQTRERNLASLLIKMLSNENSIFQWIWSQQHFSQLFPSSLLSS